LLYIITYAPNTGCVDSYKLFHVAPVLFAANRGGIHFGAWLILLGIGLFSGSIYAIILQPQWRALGYITPLGGLFLIAGWLQMATNAR
jgi:uncharacterized membrane protein YgdD (TMEM256/DUF423 family)